MIEGFAYYASLAVLVAALGILGITRDFSLRRTVVVISFLGILPVMFLASVDLLSRPRPVYTMLEFQKPDIEEAEIKGIFMKENEYINLLLMWPGLEYPRYYSYPWDKQMAEQLQAAQGQAERENSGGLMLTFPFDDSLDRREHEWAHPIPSPKSMFPKGNQKQDHFEFDRNDKEPAPPVPGEDA